MAEAQAALRRGFHLRHIQERVRSQLSYLPERASLTPEMRTECPRIPSPGVVGQIVENEPKARIIYELALGMLIALAFRKKRQAVRSGS